MKLTEFLGLKKPLTVEKYDVNVFNANSDTIDSAISKLTSDLSTDSKNINKRIDETIQTVNTNKADIDKKLKEHTDNSDIHFTTTERQKLKGIESGAQVNTVTGIKGNKESKYRVGNINLTPANIGADTEGSASQSLKDAKKYTDDVAATKINLSQIDMPNGVAPLDANRKLPSANILFGTTVGTCYEGSTGQKLRDDFETHVIASDANFKKLTKDMDAEIKRATDSESQINAKLSTETTRAKEAEETITDNLNAEITRAKGAEKTNSDAITAEATRAKSAEKANSDAIATETSRASTAEKVNADAIAAEANRAKTKEDTLSKNISTETTRATTAEKKNADAIAAEAARAKAAEASISQTIQTNKPVWEDKYTKNEIDNKFSTLEMATDWKESVASYSNITSTYPNPQDGWTVNVKDTNITYRYDGKNWIAISANAIPKATQSVDGLLSKEDKKLYDDANSKKHTHSNKSVLDGITATLITAWNGAVTHISDTVKHITATERTNWNDANSKKHTHSNKSVLDGITSALVTAWNSAVTHISNKSNPHGVSCSQIGALPTSGGTITDTLRFNKGGSDTTNTPQAQLYGIMGSNDAWRIAVGASAVDAGWVEIATLDNGNEQIYARQYGASGLVHQITLMDGAGNQTFNTINSKKLVLQNTDTTASPLLTLSGKTVSSQIYGAANPRIRFSNITDSQSLELQYTDYDTVRASSGITLVGEQGGEWFQAPKMYADTFIGSLNGNASTATKATQDSAGQQINTTYVKGLSASGRTITITKGNGSTSTLTTQDTTYGTATPSVSGLMSAADKSKLDGITSGANSYTHPTTSGNKHIPSGGASGQILRWSADGTAVWGADNNTTYTNFKGATASTTGGSGLVPAPTAGSQTKYLRADGTWQIPPDTNTWRGIQNNLTSDSTTDSLSAAQGKVLKTLVDDKADAEHNHNTLTIQTNGTTVGTYNGSSDETINIEISGSSSGDIGTPKNIVGGTSNVIEYAEHGSGNIVMGDKNTVGFNYSKGSLVTGESNTLRFPYCIVGGFKNSLSSKNGLNATGYSIVTGYANSAENQNFRHSVLAGNGNTVESSESSVICGTGNTISSSQCLVSGEYCSDNGTNKIIVGMGSPGSNRNCFRVNQIGNVFGVQPYSTSGIDYAELFEWEDGNPNNEDRRGLFVSLIGDKISLATNSSDVLGIISAHPTVIGNDYSDQWSGQIKKDIFGKLIFEEQFFPAVTKDIKTELVDPITREITIQTETVEILPDRYELAPVISEEYDPNREYISRQDRPEWDAVGVLGQLVVVDDGSCEVGKYCGVTAGGIGTASHKHLIINDDGEIVPAGWKVMKRVDDNHVLVWFNNL